LRDFTYTERIRNKAPVDGLLVLTRKRIERHLIDCACGCGTKIYDINSYGRPRRYIHGHNNRGGRCSSWNEGRTKKNGYWIIKKPDHPQANNQGYIMEHRLVYEDSRNCCILPWAIIHHRDGNRANNVWYNLMLVVRSEHSKIHHPRKDLGAICRCGSMNIRLRGIRNDRQRFRCNDCNDAWSISIPELEIMLKEYKAGLRDAIKNPRIDIESLGLKCVYCDTIDIVRTGIKNDKHVIRCNICHKYWYIPKLDIRYRLSKRNKNVVIQTVQDKPYVLIPA
jgi:hypothetical protein